MLSWSVFTYLFIKNKQRRLNWKDWDRVFPTFNFSSLIKYNWLLVIYMARLPLWLPQPNNWESTRKTPTNGIKFTHHNQATQNYYNMYLHWQTFFILSSLPTHLSHSALLSRTKICVSVALGNFRQRSDTELCCQKVSSIQRVKTGARTHRQHYDVQTSQLCWIGFQTSRI